MSNDKPKETPKPKTENVTKYKVSNVSGKVVRNDYNSKLKLKKGK